jgi:hypothetical protein
LHTFFLRSVLMMLDLPTWRAKQGHTRGREE